MKSLTVLLLLSVATPAIAQTTVVPAAEPGRVVITYNGVDLLSARRLSANKGMDCRIAIYKDHTSMYGCAFIDDVGVDLGGDQ